MRIHTEEQLLRLLDEIVGGAGARERTSRAAGEYWAELLTREGHPLNVDVPDENLLDWQARGLLGDLAGRRVLDVGCGAGRNTRWFAEQGAVVDGIDVAAGLLDHVRASMPGGVTLTACDVLRDDLPGTGYDIVYDSGCFHHLAPHRRATYLGRLLPTIAPGGRFGLVTFAAGRMGSALTDAEILAGGDMVGGIGYSPDDLRAVFEALQPVEVRPVRDDVDGAFGADFLLAALFAR